jgi:predicted ferric reductase
MGVTPYRRAASAGLAYLHEPAGKEATMLATIAIILVVLWLLGIVSSYTIGGFIHILLVVAIILVLLRIIQGRRVLD